MDPFLLFMFHDCLCFAVLYVPRADLLAHLFVMFYCVLVAFPYGVPGQVWNLIVTIPDLCLTFTSTLRQCKYYMISFAVSEHQH